MASSDLKDVTYQLASVEPSIRQKGFFRLKKMMHKVSSDDFKRISIGLFYYYWYSDGFHNQVEDRERIISLVNLVSESNKLQWMCVLIESWIQLWERIDTHRIDKYLSFEKEFIIGTYQFISQSSEARKLWVGWNEFLSEKILFQKHS